MSEYESDAYESKACKVPPTGQGTVEQYEKLFKQKISYDSTDRQIDTARWRKADLYDRGYQWLRPAFTHAGSGKPTQFSRIRHNPNDPTSIPTPVFNEGLGIRQNETARLGRPEYKPFVRPSGENPSIKVRLGAKKGKDVLLYELQRMEFDKQEDLVYWHMPAYGDATLVGRWEQTWDKTTTIPVSGAVSCSRRPGAQAEPDLSGPLGAETLGIAPPSEPCDFTLASPKVPYPDAVKFGIAEPGFEDAPVDYDVLLCPQCQDHPETVRFQPNMEEAKGKDSIGRPLGEQKPLGQWTIQTFSPYDVYLENGGVDIDPSDQREITLCHVESLDWVALRFPDKAQAVKAENPASLMEYHPHGGSPELYQAAGSAQLFGNHVRIKEYHRKPTMVLNEMSKQFEMDKGRSIIKAGDVILLDGDFLIEDINQKGGTVERIEWVTIPWEILEGGRLARGLSLWDVMFDAQDIINNNESFTQATNQRGAVLTLLARKGHNFETGPLDGMPGRLATFDTDPLAPQEQPGYLETKTIDRGITANSENATQYLQRAGGKSDVEGGSTPPGVAAATAIAQLLEQSAEHRKPRIRRIRAAFKKLWSHGLRLIAALWIEPRDIRFESEDGEEKWAALHGLDLEGQTDVDLEPEPISDSPDIRRENVRDLINLRVITPGVNPVMDRRIAKALDAPSEFYTDEDLQESAAQREYEDFIEKQKAPVMNPSLDEHGTHYQEHGRAAHSERFRALMEQAGWGQALEVLSGDWDQNIKLICMTPIPMVPGTPLMLPGMPPDPSQPPVQPGQPMPPVQSFQSKIKNSWLQKLALAGFKAPDGPAFDQVATWLAHAEAHKAYGELKAMAAAPQMAAPAGDEGAGGQVAA